MGHVIYVPKGVSIRVLIAMNEGRVVDVSMKMNDMQGLAIGSHNRKCNGVVSTQHYRHSFGIQQFSGHVCDALESALYIGGPHISIANIGDSPMFGLVLKEDLVSVLVIVATGPESEGVFSNRSRSEAGARHEG